MPFCGGEPRISRCSDFAADGFRGPQSERFCESAIQPQDAISGVVNDDEIGNGVEIFHPLLARLLDAREKPDIFQRHRGVACERFEELAFGGGKFARQIYKA